jgi:hypothetical protein
MHDVEVDTGRPCERRQRELDRDGEEVRQVGDEAVV